MNLRVLIIAIALISSSGRTQAQIDEIQDVFVKPEYRSIDFTVEQEELTNAKYVEIQNDDLLYWDASEVLNQYIYAILDEDQRAKFDELEKASAERYITRNYSYLELDSNQFERFTLYYLDSTKTLSFRIKMRTIDEYVFSSLNTKQLLLKERRDKEQLEETRKYVSRKDEGFEQRASVSIQILELIENFYYPRLLRKSKSFIKSLEPQDREMLIELQLLYQEHIELARKHKLNLFVDDSLVVMSENQWKYYNAKFDQFMLKPNLCLYTCFLYGTEEISIKEEDKMINSLNILYDKYSDEIKKWMNRIERVDEKYNEMVSMLEEDLPKQGGIPLTKIDPKRVENIVDCTKLLLIMDL